MATIVKFFRFDMAQVGIGNFGYAYDTNRPHDQSGDYISLAEYEATANALSRQLQEANELGITQEKRIFELQTEVTALRFDLSVITGLRDYQEKTMDAYEAEAKNSLPIAPPDTITQHAAVNVLRGMTPQEALEWISDAWERRYRENQEALQRVQG